LGYGGISSSVAIAFNIYNSGTSVVPGFAVYQDGNVSGVYMPTGDVSLVNGQPIDVHLTVHGGNATMTLTQGANTFMTNFALDIATAVGGEQAYLGFTGATGGGVARQEISNFSYVADNLPDTIAFSAALASATITLSDGWTNAADTSALRVASDVTIEGTGQTLAMASGVQKRHLLVEGGGDLTVSGLTFTGGYGNDFGGSIWSFGSLTVRDSTFTGNFAGQEGGAIQSWGGSPLLVVENTTIAGNTTSGIASAIGAGATQTSFTNLTIVDNVAPTSGATLWLYQTVVEMTNSIVARNTNDGVQTNGVGAFSAQSSNNLVGVGVWTGLDNNTNQLGVNDPLLGTLSNNGGPTQTIALLLGSPAIDAGTNTVSLRPFDQRGAGFHRVAGAAVDIGAFELQNQPPQFTSLSSANLPENTQLVLPLTATDPDVPAQTITFAIAGTGADNDKFEIVGGNQLRFITPPDFENPLDLGGTTVGDNIYEVSVQADDGNGGTTLQTLSVLVTNVDEIAPVVVSFKRQSPTQVLTNADSLQFRAEFSEQVQGVDTSDFVVSGGSNAAVNVAVPVQGTGEPVYLLTVSGGNLAAFNGSVGIDLASLQNITDTTGNLLSTVEPSIDETYTLDNTAPKVSGVIIDDGSTQRSRVRSITINFDSEIVFDAGAFELKTFSGTVIAVQTNVAPGVTANRVVLSFPGTIGGSLADGNYRLRILDTHIRDAAGNALDGDENGSAGAVRVDEFFRLFGDMDGDRDVDAFDTRGLRATYRKAEGQLGFDNLFDFDGDADVDAIDQQSLSLRYRTMLSP
jgi:hypothetical protein